MTQRLLPPRSHLCARWSDVSCLHPSNCCRPWCSHPYTLLSTHTYHCCGSSAGHVVLTGAHVCSCCVVLILLPTGNCGISVDLPAPTEAASPELSTYAALYAEELGLVLEVHPDKAALVSSLFNQAGVPCSIIGSVLPEQKVSITVAGEAALSGNTAALRCEIQNLRMLLDTRPRAYCAASTLLCA